MAMGEHRRHLDLLDCDGIPESRLAVSDKIDL